jgi:hypothetical protein
VNSAAPSEAGERKNPLSLTEPTGFAETTRIQDSGFRSPLLAPNSYILFFPSVSPVCSSEAGERKNPLSLTEPAGFAEKKKRIQDSGFRLQVTGERIQVSGFRRKDPGYRLQASDS